MIPVPSARVIIAVTVLATALAMPSRAAEKLPAHPKLVYRQIGAGFTLALEAAPRDKTFFLCAPYKTFFCISTTAIGWRKPFIVTRTDGVASGFDVYDTSKKDGHAVHHSELPSPLKNVPLYPAAVVWEKLSPTKPVW